MKLEFTLLRRRDAGDHLHTSLPCAGHEMLNNRLAILLDGKEKYKECVSALLAVCFILGGPTGSACLTAEPDV